MTIKIPSLDEIRRVKYDIMILGAGGTGLRAAIAASDENKDLSIGVVTKSLLGKAHTVMAEGGVAASFGNVDRRDNWKVHFKDTYKGGGYHNNWRLAEILVKEAPNRIMELEYWGAVFDRTPDGKILQRNFGGHQYPRLAHVGDRTGLELLRTLQETVIHRENVTIHMETTIAELLVNDGKITGALGYKRESGELIIFETRAIIMASGGLGKLFTITSNSWEGTGDGHALAYRAGAELIDMEFIQFHPTGMAWPTSVQGILVTEGVRGEGGILKNRQGERFMFNYIPDRYKDEYADTEEEANRWLAGERDLRKPPELLTRDVVAAAIRAEVNAGRGSTHDAAYLDIGAMQDADYIKKKLPSMYHQMKTLAGIDITKEPVEVAPTAHHCMGGIRFDVDTNESNIQGLFAAGECAGGVHAANRLGGNALADIMVFGARAGHAVAKIVPDREWVAHDEKKVREALFYTLQPFNEGNHENPYRLQKELQQLVSKYKSLGTTKDLKEGIEKLNEMAIRINKVKATGNRVYNPSWHSALDLKNLLVCGYLILTGSLQRNESRGAHRRSDYPEINDEYRLKTFVLTKGEGKKVNVVTIEIEDLPPHLKEVMAEYDT